jgi:hypothetical protein
VMRIQVALGTALAALSTGLAKADTCALELVELDNGLIALPFPGDAGTVNLIIDTGADISIFPRSLQKNIPHNTSTYSASGFKGRIKLELRRSNNDEPIASLPCDTNLKYIVAAPLGTGDSFFDDGYAAGDFGLLGSDVLSAWKARINIAELRLTVSVPDHDIDVPREIKNKTTTVNFAGTTGECIVDTGFNHRATIFAGAASSLAVVLDKQCKTLTSSHEVSRRGIVREVASTKTTIGQMEPGYAVASIEERIVEEQNANGDPYSLYDQCRVGLSLLRASIIHYDSFGVKTVEGSMLPPEYNQLGIASLSTQDGAGPVLNAIYPDSPAEVAGLSTGDTIIMVNEDHLFGNNIGPLIGAIFSSQGTVSNLTIQDQSGDLRLLSVTNRHFLAPCDH